MLKSDSIAIYYLNQSIFILITDRNVEKQATLIEILHVITTIIIIITQHVKAWRQQTVYWIYWIAY